MSQASHFRWQASLLCHDRRVEGVVHILEKEKECATRQQYICVYFLASCSGKAKSLCPVKQFANHEARETQAHRTHVPAEVVGVQRPNNHMQLYEIRHLEYLNTRIVDRRINERF